MAIQRFFYVTQDALVVWCGSDKSLSEEITFANSDDGLQLFSAWLKKAPLRRSLMVVDVIEEEFDTDSLPKISGADRKSLIERRLAKRFSRASFRRGVFLGARRRASDEFNVIFSAITNHELVDPWIEVIAQHKSPLVGVTSVPLLSMDLLRRFRKPAENAMFLTEHQGGRLRLVFAKSGQPISARLSRTLSRDEAESGNDMIAEILQSRMYLERSRRLAAADHLDVYLIADEEKTTRIFGGESRVNLTVHAIEPEVAARSVGLGDEFKPGHMEALYLAHCRKKTPRERYEMRGRTNYSRLLRLRHATIGFAVASAIVCSMVAGLLLSSAFSYRSTTQEIEVQLAQMEENYRRENAEFEPIRADSHEMKLAVDTGDYILKNTLPVAWVMSQVGLVMDKHADMHISNLRWEVETVSDPNQVNDGRRNDRNRPVPISAAGAVNARISGEIRPYDGNLRHAFEKIDQLARSLQDETAFENVSVLEYPIDASPGAALSGEVRRVGNNQLANFSLNMTLRVADDAS